MLDDAWVDITPLGEPHLTYLVGSHATVTVERIWRQVEVELWADWEWVE